MVYPMYNTLFKNAVFPMMELYYGTTIQRDLNWLNKTQWWTQDQLNKLQNKKLRALIKHAYENVPYYHKIFKERNLKPGDIISKEDLNKLPLLTKDIIRENLQNLKATSIGESHFIECHSSGSTGEPLNYYIDKRTYSHNWAQTFRCWGWAGYDLGDSYVKISLNPRKTFNGKIQDQLMRCTYIHAFDIHEKTLMNQIQKIRNSKAKIIRGYASSTYLLARHMKEKDITDIHLDAVMTTGDTLFPHYRELIESQFNCKVFDGYGGEGMVVSFECEKHGGYHISQENVIAEFMRKDEHVDAGELGEIVLTNLNNYAMPFIRYKIGDVGKPSDSLCSCGRGLSMMKSIEGRDTDIVVTPSGKFLIVHFFTWLFEYIEGVDQFQVIQESIDELIVKIVRNPKFRDLDLDHIKKTIKRGAGEGMNITVNFVESIPLAKSGKRRFVISKILHEYF